MAIKVMSIEEIRDRIAELMKWKREDVDKFSLPTLKSFVRGKDAHLDEVLQDAIDSGRHLFVGPP